MKIEKSIVVFRDTAQVQLPEISPEKREKLFRDSAVGAAPPKLSVRIEATHAGIINGNDAFYRPDVMKEYVSSYVEPYNKPVLVHHDQKQDPVGRIVRATYIDTSNRYVEPIRQFKASFDGKTFIDSKTNKDKAKNQFQWLYDNLMKADDYRGLGFIEVEAYITDMDAAEKILDKRYLTVSIGFSTDQAHCSQCGQNWADGICEHTPGKMYDDYPMVLIPQKMMFDELSWVNRPADAWAQVTEINKLSISDNMQPSRFDRINVRPILSNDKETGIYLVDFYVDTPKTEVIEVRSNKHEKPELVTIDGSQWVKSRVDGLGYESRKHYLAKAGKGEDADHLHRCIIDPQTDNGFTDYVDGHIHEIVNMKIKEAERWDYDEEAEKSVKWGAHTHPMGDEIPKLGYDAATGRTIPESTTGVKMKKKMKKVKCSTDDKVEEKLIELDDDIPEGWELVEEVEVDVEDQMPPKAGKPKAPKAGGKRKKGKGAPGFGGGSGQTQKDSADPDDDDDEEEDDVNADEVDVNDETEPSDADDDKDDSGEEAENGQNEFTDEVLKDKGRFYDLYVSPVLDELNLSDAKLSPEQRSKLKASDFCGPNKSFPVNDCAHVTAARRLIGRYKGTGKEKILACVARKAKSLGCDTKKDELVNDVVNFVINDNSYAVLNIEGFSNALATIGTDAVKENSDKLYDVAALFGITKERWDKVVNDGVGLIETSVPLDEAQKTLDDKANTKITEEAVDGIIAGLADLDEETREVIVEKLISKLQEKEFIPDYDAEFADALKEKEQLVERADRLTRLNKDLYLNVQKMLAGYCVDLKIKLGKENYTNLTDEDKVAKINDLQVRSIDNLADAVSELIDELLETKKSKQIEELADNATNNSEENTSPISNNQLFIEDDTNELIRERARRLQTALLKKAARTGRKN